MASRGQCNVIHLNFPETEMERKMDGKEVVNGDRRISFKKIVICTRTTSLRNLGIFLHKVNSKSEHHMRKLGDKLS